MSDETDRATYIHGIATAVPQYRYEQEDVGRILGGQLPERSKARRLMHRIYGHSGIDYRHSVIPDYRTEGPDGQFFTDEEGTFGWPSTGTRNDLYTKAARKLFRTTAQSVLERADAQADEISHVITVSCTGFFAPGPDFYLVKDLGMSPDTQRYHIGFMGCYAAFPALKMARSMCRSTPGAAVLIVCLELCSLHLQPSEVIDDIIASSVFADGAAGVLVRSTPPDGSAGLRMDAFSSMVAPDSEEDMAWSIGDKGFDMVLSTYVPKVLEMNIAPAVDDLIGDAGIRRRDIDRWAIHPGGRAILEHIARALELDEDDLDEAREVLRLYGNMSSPTVLFVLSRILDQTASEGSGDRIFAAAFGPGLTVESGIFTRIGISSTA